MHEPELKYENNKHYFMQIYNLKLFIALGMTYSCGFSLGGI